MSNLKFKVGDDVAFNDLPDAVWFTILSIEGHAMMIREAGTDYREQRSDTSLVKRVRKAA